MKAISRDFVIVNSPIAVLSHIVEGVNGLSQSAIQSPKVVVDLEDQKKVLVHFLEHVVDLLHPHHRFLLGLPLFLGVHRNSEPLLHIYDVRVHYPIPALGSYHPRQ